MRNARVLAGLALLVAGVAICACAREASQSARDDTPPAPWKVIVDAAWLRAHAASEGVIVVDARSPSDYAQGHVPGAVNVPRAATYDSAPGNTDNLAPLAGIEALMSAAGVSSDAPVVIYDDQTYKDAARVFWVLEVHGHPRVAVLNGGLAGWMAAGLPVSTEPAPRRPAAFIANLQPDRLASKLQVRQALGDGRLVLLDSRTEEEYVGLKTETERAGHIPSAVCADVKRSLLTDERGVCQILDVDLLRDAHAWVPPGRRIITYCNTGTRASLSYLVLRSLGRDVSVYDGSWREWSADPSLPVATGREAGWAAEAQEE